MTVITRGFLEFENKPHNQASKDIPWILESPLTRCMYAYTCMFIKLIIMHNKYFGAEVKKRKGLHKPQHVFFFGPAYIHLDYFYKIPA